MQPLEVPQHASALARSLNRAAGAHVQSYLPRHSSQLLASVHWHRWIIRRHAQVVLLVVTLTEL